jgi:hypothetical protein
MALMLARGSCMRKYQSRADQESRCQVPSPVPSPVPSRLGRASGVHVHQLGNRGKAKTAPNRRVAVSTPAGKQTLAMAYFVGIELHQETSQRESPNLENCSRGSNLCHAAAPGTSLGADYE